MRKLILIPVAVLMFFIPGSPKAVAAAGVSLTGAGSSFVFPFFSASLSAYSSGHHVQTTYQALGNAFALRNIRIGGFNFMGLDDPLPTADQPGDFVQIPIALGGAAVVYNLSGVKHLKLSGPVLAGIYLGQIRSWSDNAIRRLNPHAPLPNQQIRVFHYSMPTGSSYEFTDFLSHASAEWKLKVGAGELPAWPTGTGVPPSGQIGALPALSMNLEVRTTPGAIGYEYTTYAAPAQTPIAQIRNEAGRFIEPTQASIAADAQDFNHLSVKDPSIVDGAGPSSYPISGYSWMVTIRHQADAIKGRAVIALMRWLVTNDQTFAVPLGYATMPRSARKFALAAIDRIRV